MEARAELGLDEHDRLDIFVLAEYLAIPVFTIGEIANVALPNSFVHYFSTVDPDSFSAVTIFLGYRRFIIHNGNHHPHRQSSNLAHEISHSLLEHEPTPVADNNGRRFWDAQVEEEASWLGAALLIPRAGALDLFKAGRTVAQIASHFGVSQALCEWRIRQSGIDKQTQRWSKNWGR